MSGSSTIATTEPMLGTLRVQTSMYGLAVRLMWGQPRVPGNLLWFGNFVATAHTTTQSSGGKGGGGVTQTSTTYSYTAAAMLALGRGPINGIVSAWQDKRRFAGEAVPAKKVTLTHTATVGAGGLTVNVPLAGGTFGANAGVATPDLAPYEHESGL